MGVCLSKDCHSPLDNTMQNSLRSVPFMHHKAALCYLIDCDHPPTSNLQFFLVNYSHPQTNKNTAQLAIWRPNTRHKYNYIRTCIQNSSSYTFVSCPFNKTACFVLPFMICLCSIHILFKVYAYFPYVLN